MTSPLIEPNDLKRAIQQSLNRHRDELPNAQIDADAPVFQDGYWQCIVHAGSKKAGKIANVLATVEEEIMGKHGVNVLLVPAND